MGRASQPRPCPIEFGADQPPPRLLLARGPGTYPRAGGARSRLAARGGLQARSHMPPWCSTSGHSCDWLRKHLQLKHSQSFDWQCFVCYGPRLMRSVRPAKEPCQSRRFTLPRPGMSVLDRGAVRCAGAWATRPSLGSPTQGSVSNEAGSSAGDGALYGRAADGRVRRGCRRK